FRSIFGLDIRSYEAFAGSPISERRFVGFREGALTLATDRYFGKVQNPAATARPVLEPRRGGGAAHWPAPRLGGRSCARAQACAALAFCTSAVNRRAK